jgi:hypothetical protein
VASDSAPGRADFWRLAHDPLGQKAVSNSAFAIARRTVSVPRCCPRSQKSISENYWICNPVENFSPNFALVLNLA